MTVRSGLLPDVAHIARSATIRRVARDIAIATTVLLVLVVGSLIVGNEVIPDQRPLALMPVAAAGVATAALLTLLTARLHADARLGWLGAALGIYSLVAIPAVTAGVLGIGSPAAVGGVRLLAYSLVTASLAVALLGPPAMTARRTAACLLAAAAAVAGAGLLGARYPSVVQSITDWRPLRLAVDLVWVGIAVAIAISAARRHDWALWHVSGGIALLGAVHCARMIMVPAPTADLDLTFASLRLGAITLAAITLVVSGTARMAFGAIARLSIDREAQEEELRLAQIRLERTAERDHELRNGLAGLVGATRVMHTEAPATEVTQLGTAVAAELNRLDDLLQAPVDRHRKSPAPSGYAVAPVLTGLVALRRWSGMDLRLEVEPGLRARGSSAVLAQVVTNLLRNAERHAPGSPVQITAARESDQVAICVRDVGLGIPPEREAAVLDPHVQDRASGGGGMGLHICRSLLAAENGTIKIRPTSPDRPGWAVEVRVPTAMATTTVASRAS